jgi:RimJ/RimL family protein N-acetyltransferase
MNTADTPMDIAPVRLQGRYARLEPLRLEHVDGLAEVGLDPDLWQWIPWPVTTPEQMRAYVQQALDEQQRGLALPFATIDAQTGRAIGCTRFCAIDARNRRLEIGWTWIARSHHRSGVNTEVKTLMLAHAFETLGAFRVELKTDALNQRSRNAILRLGAQQEGIFRRHVLTSTGRVRDSVYFSILDSEWPDVKARLVAKLR